MLEFLFTKLGSTITTIGLAIGSFFGFTPEKEVFYEPQPLTEEVRVEDEVFGATFQTPEVRALFETTLAERITSSATSMTLTSATDVDGTTFASSTYAFIIDEGTANEEFVLADCTGTACTNLTRGVSSRTGTTTVATLQKEHRRGASVKITDAPSLLFVMNALKGRQNIENALTYSSSVGTTSATFPSTYSIPNRGYVDALSFGAVPAASETASGFVELATGCEAASSTSSGTAARLAIPATLATSTYNSATAPCRVISTNNTGKIDYNFVATSTGLFTNITLTGTTTFTGNIVGTASSTVKTYLNAASPATWTKPSLLKYVVVEVVGGGGGGGGVTNNDNGGGGGGGGGYSRETIPASSLGATETVTIGAGGTAGVGSGATAGGTGGTSSFGTSPFLQATGGAGGAGGTTGVGGTAGVGSGGDVNSYGGDGGTAMFTNATHVTISGYGGNSFFGGGATAVLADGTEATAGIAGKVYGGGASGASNANSSADAEGAVGGAGIVIVTEFY